MTPVLNAPGDAPEVSAMNERKSACNSAEECIATMFRETPEIVSLQLHEAERNVCAVLRKHTRRNDDNYTTLMK
jgi:hypothetical protein